MTHPGPATRSLAATALLFAGAACSTSRTGGAVPDDAAVTDAAASDADWSEDFDAIPRGDVSQDVAPRPDANADVMACEATERPVLAACLVGPGIDDGGGTIYAEGLVLNMRASVVEVGTGAPPDNCFGFVGGGRLDPLGSHVAEDPALEQARWATLQSESGDRYTFAAVAPGETPPALSTDDDVDVSLSLNPGDFAPTLASLTLKLAASDTLHFWYGQGGDVSDLTPPDGLALTAGNALCEETGDCVERYERRDLRVERDGVSEAVPYASAIDFAGLRVVSGGYDVQTGPSQCSDAFVAWAATAAWPH